jgi:murein DD-endopeptidase MepM/ murein hydrolase activator NlpD
MQGIGLRVSQFAKSAAALASRIERRDRLTMALAAMAVVAGSAALAAPVVRERARDVAEAVVQAQQPAQPVSWKEVWSGADIDGDGQADFANPTGGDVRGHDEYGYGEFGASRDGGSRQHEGVDFMAQAGQAVLAPISGYVTKIGYAYPGDHNLKFVEITNPALNYVGRVFYVNPTVEEGQAVAIGRKIGEAHTLQAKYRDGMTDHVHLELMDGHGRRFDAEHVLTAHLQQVSNQG